MAGSPSVVRYKNPLHRPYDSTYGPDFYETSATGREYRGYLIYERIAGSVWDIVRDGVCVSQYAGPSGARRAIDGYEEEARKTDEEAGNARDNTQAVLPVRKRVVHRVQSSRAG